MHTRFVFTVPNTKKNNILNGVPKTQSLLGYDNFNMEVYTLQLVVIH